MALAAHLARADREQVSLVVVPRYLEADPGLENQLRSQDEMVEDGVVLGSTKVLPEDTRTLLRQLLRSADQESVLAQLENNFSSAGVLIAALIGLVSFGVVAATAPVLIRERMGMQQSTSREPVKSEPDRGWKPPRPEPTPDKRARPDRRVLIVRVQPSKQRRPKWATRAQHNATAARRSGGLGRSDPAP